MLVWFGSPGSGMIGSVRSSVRDVMSPQAVCHGLGYVPSEGLHGFRKLVATVAFIKALKNVPVHLVRAPLEFWGRVVWSGCSATASTAAAASPAAAAAAPTSGGGVSLIGRRSNTACHSGVSG